MPPYVIIETYVRCPDGALQPLHQQFQALLDRLGYSSPEAAQWHANLGWDAEDQWFGPTSDEPRKICGLAVNGKELFARAGVLGWSAAIVPGLQEHWVSLELSFETESTEQYLVTASVFAPVAGKYIAGLGRALWQVMCQFASEFPHDPIYCVFEGWEGESWQALVTGRGNLWSFDAALVPWSLADRFKPVPGDYVVESQPQGIALARPAVWSKLPWQE